MLDSDGGIETRKLLNILLLNTAVNYFTDLFAVMLPEWQGVNICIQLNVSAHFFVELSRISVFTGRQRYYMAICSPSSAFQ